MSTSTTCRTAFPDVVDWSAMLIDLCETPGWLMSEVGAKLGSRERERAIRDLDHERDITLAIHAALPDVIRDTKETLVVMSYRLAAAASWP